jgi:hypothetical protein
MDPGRIDLTPLALPDLTRERLARRVLARVQLAPRGPLGVLGAWVRPGLAAAAAIGGLSLLSFGWTPAPEAERAQLLTVAEGLRLPAPAAEWIAEGRPPSEADLLESWEP